MDTAVLAVRTILSLAVVLGLIWYAGRRLDDSTSGRGGDGKLAAWVRKAGGVVGRAPARGRRRAERPAPVVAVVGRQAIGPKASVAVVDVGDQRLVLGVSDAGVALLTTMAVPEIPEPFAVEEAAPAESVASAASVVVPTSAAVSLTKPAPTAAVTSTDPVTVPAPATLPDFDEVFAAATAAPQPSGVAGSILSPATWRQARAALRTGPTS